MKSFAVVLALSISGGALAQAPVPGQTPPAGRPSTPSPEPVSLTLSDALERARTYSQQVYSAAIAAQIAHEDTVQARAALLPTLNMLNQFIYTQPNGTPSGVFVANNGTHEYGQQAIIHGDVYSPAKRADYRRIAAGEAVARARAEVAARGLIAVVVQNYYGVAASQRKLANARQSLAEAEQFVDITQKQEAGGEVSHADVVKSQIQLEQRRIEVMNAEADLEKTRLGFGVLLFSDYGQPYTVVDDLDGVAPLPPVAEMQALISRNSPDLRAAQSAVTQQNFEIRAARAGFYPTVSLEYTYGLDGNQYAIHDSEGHRLLGSAAVAQLNIPIWNWGATRSKIRQAELRMQQARNDLSLTQRQLQANLNAFHVEAATAAAQVDSLRRSLGLATESLRLVLLRYQAGEVTVLEVVDAQATLATARNALADGLVRYRLALANLQTITGAF